MSQSKNKRTDNRSVKKPPRSEATEREPTRKRTWLLIALLVMVAIGATVGISIYVTQVIPLQQTVIVVGDTSINMGYFLRRTLLAGEDPVVILGTLTEELLIKQGAPGYGIEVSPEEIDEALRERARGESGTISDSEFKEWYRQQLNESRLSDSEFRDLAEIVLLRARLHQYLAERVPTVAEQRYLHIMIVESLEEAETVRARWEAGEDFADLAREVSLHESKENGGDIGWVPRGAMLYDLELAAFSLSIGDVSQPLGPSEEEDYFLLMVSEEAAAREIDEGPLQVLKGGALGQWLAAETLSQKVEWHGRNNGYDSETHTWITWQLERMKE